MKITLPSGFSGIARKFKAADLQALVDQMDDDTDELSDAGLSSIVKGAWQETTDPGPYSDMSTGDIRPRWDRMLKGDLVGMLFQIRVGAFRNGREYDFVFRCSSCGKRNEWTIDLVKHVLQRVKELPQSSYQHLATGDPLETRLHDGTTVLFRLQKSDHEKPFHKLRRQQVRKKQRKSLEINAIDRVAMQIVGVFEPPPGWEPGGENQNLKGQRGRELPFHSNVQRIWQWVHDLDLDDLYDLQDDFEQADCGYHTDIKVRCVKEGCRWEQVVDVPLQRTFLVPTRRSSKKTENGSPQTGSSSSSSSHGPSTQNGSESASIISVGSSTEVVATASPDSVS
jgi:hypothetical protein